MAGVGERELLTAVTPDTTQNEERVERNPGGALEGSVIDLAGRPVAGVLVALDSKSLEPIERVSDAEGRFAIDELSGDQEWSVRAELEPAWKFCHSTGVHLSPEGTWLPLVVVMTSWGTLDVALQDGLGAPITEGVSVRVTLSAVEHSSRPTAASTPVFWAAGQAFMSSLDQDVGEDGVAHFPWVWADRRLRIEIATRDGPRAGERHVRGLLVHEKDELAGEVIRVPAGGHLALRAQPFELRRTLAGKVRFSDGRPVMKPSVFLRANGRPFGEEYRVEARGEEDGTFSVVLDKLREGEVLRVRATDGHGDQHTGSHSGGTEVLVAGLELRADIVVQPMLPIAGRITRGGNPPNPGTLRILAEPPEDPAAPDDIGYQPVTPEGFFQLGSLAPGSYELEFSERGYMADAKFSLKGVRAGDTAIVWELPEGEFAHLSIAIRAARKLSQYSLIVAQPLERSQTTGWSAAPASWAVSSGGWPHRICSPSNSGGGGWCSLGETQFQYRLEKYDAILGAAQKELDLPAGVYALAAVAWDADGSAFAPVLSDPVRFAAGRYQITFELAPTASVEGSVEGVHPELGLELIALDAEGRRLPLFDSNGMTKSRMPLSSEGRFAARGLPAGAIVLRVATPQDLERGLFGAEQRLELVAGETAEVTLKW